MIKLIQGECLEKMKDIPDNSIDMVLCDLPYGTTQNKWDSVIPLVPLWEHYKRICAGAVVLTAAQPFTTLLIHSNLKNFRYEWIWKKNLPTGHATAKYMPMRSHESILVFGCSIIYNKQPTVSNIKDRKLGGSNGIRAKAKSSETYGNLSTKESEIILKTEVAPRSIIEISCVPRATGTLHPTQKPVALMEYLIRTYTNEGDTVLDNTMGSGTTGVACANLNRSFIGIEQDENYFAIAEKRIREAELDAL